MSHIIKNSFWLLVAQVGGLLIPLVELPILSRALGPQRYGQVLYALGLALMASIFVEFGFSFSAARSVVRLRKDKTALAQLVADVFFAKLLLSLFAALIIVVIVLLEAGATVIPNYWLIWIVISIMALGFSPIWYYIGMEELVFPALWDLGARLTGLFFTFLFVFTPQHGQRMLVIQAMVGAINTLIPTIKMVRRTGFGCLNVRGVRRTLSESMELFLYKGAQSVMGVLASIILGFLGSARAVGAFVPAEKMVRAATGIVGPTLNAAFPYLVKMQSKSEIAAKKATWKFLIILSAFTMAFSISMQWLAPWAINIVFGSGYGNSITLLQMLVWIVPLRVASMALAILWFIPGGKEGFASRIMIANIAIISITAFVLVPHQGGEGMAMAFIAGEFIMFTLLFFSFIKS